MGIEEPANLPHQPDQVLAAAVSRFFDKVSEDPLLQLYFYDTDMARLKPRFATYLTHALHDDEATYPGRSVLAAHTGRGIMDEAADRFVESLVQTLREFGVPAANIEKLEGKLNALKDTVGDSFVSPDTHVYKPQRMG
jgi:hemoglobin